MRESIERQLLGTFLFEPSLICRDLEELFFNGDNRAIYKAMIDMVDEGAVIDFVSLYVHLETTIANAAVKIGELSQYLCHTKSKYLSVDVTLCIRALKEDKARNEMKRDLSDPTVDFGELQEKINSVDVGIKTVQGATLAHGLDVLHADLSIPNEERMTSGFNTIDAACSGWRKGDLVSFMARTTCGKTWWLLNVARHMAGNGRKISFFSFEGSLASTIERVVELHYDVPRQIVTPAFIDGTAMRDAAFVEYYSRTSWHNEIYSASEIGQIIDQEKPDTVMIDFLGMMKMPGDGSIYERVSSAVKELKSIAISKNVLMIYANQLSRGAEDGTIPVKAHMARDSGQIEELTDFVIGAWRPGLHAMLPSEKRLVKMEYLKVKRGDTTFLDIDLSPSGRMTEIPWSKYDKDMKNDE